MGSRASLCLEAERREVGQRFSLPLPAQPRALTSQVPQVPVPRRGGGCIYSAGTCWGSQQNSCFLIWEKGTISTGNCRKMSPKMSATQCCPLWGGGFKSCSDIISDAHCPDSSFSWWPRVPGAEWTPGQEDKVSFLTEARGNSVMETMSEQPSSPREQEHKSQHEGASCSWRVMVAGYQEGRTPRLAS